MRAQVANTHRPNIVWVSMEDTSLRFGCYGDKVARTPNIDRLAAEGRVYTHAFSTAGVCAPSRSAIITGMYQTAIGTHHMRTTHVSRHSPDLPTPYSAVLPPYVKTFTEYLRAVGYFCTNNSKTDYQFTPPLTAWDECSTEAHWRHRSPGQPFFSVFNYTMTHESRMWERAGSNFITDPDAVELPPYLPNTRKAREALARQYDNIALVDQRVGAIIEQLEADGVLDDTIVFVWADHGDGLPRSKRWVYDSGTHVPLVVWWPGHIERGSVCDDLVTLMDLGPTVLSLAGVPVPVHMHGKPFLGSQATTQDCVFAARDRHDEAYDMVRAVRDRRFRYIRNYFPNQPYFTWIAFRNNHPVMQELWRLHLEGKLEGPQKTLFEVPRPAEELYDIEKDPYEINNLAGEPEYQSTLQRMRQLLDDWRIRCGDMGDISEEQIVARMWPGGVQPKTSAPLCIPITTESYGQAPVPEGGALAYPVLVELHCLTQGASIAYTTEQGEDVHWRLYTQPLRLPVGTTVLRTKAVRIGYRDSEEKTFAFTVEPAGH